MKTNVITFSERNIKAEQSGTARTLRDPAFPLRFRFHQNRETGSWYVVRRDNWYLLGYWPVLTVAAVKKVLPEKLAMLSVSGRIVANEWGSVGDVLTWYSARIEKDSHRSKERKATIKSAIKCHLMPHLGDLALDAVNRTVLDDALIWPLQENHSLSTVKSVLSVLKQSMKQAEKLGHISTDPVASVVFTDFISTPIQPKDGRLMATALPAVFATVATRDRVTQALLIMLLCHGTRIRETLTAKWRDIDWELKQWRLPMQTTKTGDWHVLPLTDTVITLLMQYRNWQQRSGYRGVYVFPGHGHAKPLSYTSARHLIANVSEKAWSAHDCRKALKTICTDLQIDHSVSERVLNHTMSKQDKAYNQSLFMAPMRAALERYHAWLLSRGMATLLNETDARSSRSIKHNNLSHHAA